MKLAYSTNCVAAGMANLDALNDMMNGAREVSLATFRRRCDTADWERAQGYARGAEPGLHIKDDWHVRYFKSRWKGEPCFYAVHSAIEHIFAEPLP
jgi:hypothetical protein